MREIKLNLNKITIVDDEDYKRVAPYHWYFNAGIRANFVTGRVNKKQVLLHRFIMDTPKGMDTDHINGDKLDNRRSNLRICTHQQNSFNQKGIYSSSRFKGVSWNKINKTWITQLKHNYKVLYIGSFKTEHQAALAYDLWAKDLFGEYAKLNFRKVI